MALVNILVSRKKVGDKSIIGEMKVSRPIGGSVGTSYSCKTLELPWKDDKKNVSCIPAGKYKAFLRTDHKIWRVELTGTGNRTHIQIHNGNYPSQIDGCILVGTTAGEDAVYNSQVALKAVISAIVKDNAKPEIVVDIRNDYLATMLERSRTC